MSAADTNVLIRILTEDDANQSRTAKEFLQRQEVVFIPKTVLLRS
ncbi:MAG TPA: hypothetical protein VMT64_10455 [Candidatus Binataceae bacterium]|nr:hypothetical protein [Candidatus Binataceae bacterium]